MVGNFPSVKEPIEIGEGWRNQYMYRLAWEEGAPVKFAAGVLRKQNLSLRIRELKHTHKNTLSEFCAK